MVNSAAWKAQDALLARLRTLTYPAPPVAVSLGVPVNDMPDHIVIGGEVTSWDAEYGYSGSTARDERFTLTVYVRVTRSTNDYTVARDRCVALGDLVLQTIRDDQTLDGTVMLVEVSSFEMSESLTDERHRSVTLQMDVRCQAHVP